METPIEHIESLLHANDMSEARRLEVALLLAESMLRELGAAVAEWEETAARLWRLKCGATSPSSN